MSARNVPQTRRKPRADVRATAMRLLAEGLSIAEIARRVGRSTSTISKWRNSPDGRAELVAAKAAVDLALASTVDQARSLLKHAALKATERLLKVLKEGDDADALRAAAMLFDRSGLPAKEVSEVTLGPSLDLSRLSAEEFEQLRRIRAKARPAG